MNPLAILLTLCLLLPTRPVPQTPTVASSAPALIAQSPAQAGADRSTPESTIRAFLALIKAADLKTAVTCVQGAVYAPVLAGLEQQIKKDPLPFTLDEVKVTQNGDQATADCTISGGDHSGDKAMDHVILRKVGEGWLIVPGDKSVFEKMKGNNPPAISALSFLLANPQLLAKARSESRATVSLSNVRQLALGAMMLVQDYDDKFALKAETYKKSLFPYIKNNQVFTAPGETAGTVSYAFNPNLAGVKLAKVKNPANTVLFYEGRGMNLNFRYEGRTPVAFADGHAKLINAQQAKTLRWKP